MKRTKDGRMVIKPVALDPQGNLYAGTISKAKRGQCDQDTLDVLTCFAARGQGFEGAQMALGKCLISTGTNKQDGVNWIRLAAEANSADAQKELATLYYEGTEIPQDLTLAAKWNYLYLRNPKLLSLGAIPKDDLTEEIRGKIAYEDAVTADNMVKAWSPTYTDPQISLADVNEKACRTKGPPRLPAEREDLYVRPVDASVNN